MMQCLSLDTKTLTGRTTRTLQWCVFLHVTRNDDLWFSRAFCSCYVTVSGLYCTACRLDTCHVDCKMVITTELLLLMFSNTDGGLFP